MKSLFHLCLRITLAGLVLTASQQTQAQGWQPGWLTPISDAPHVHYQWSNIDGRVRVQRVKADAAGNVYAVGTYAGRVSVGPFILTSDTLASPLNGYGYSNCFLGKLDRFGQWQWVIPIEGNELKSLSDLEIDSATHTLYLAGITTSDTLWIGGRPLVNPLARQQPTNSPQPFAFLARLTPQGVCTRLQLVGRVSAPASGRTGASVRDMALDGRGGIVVCGNFMSGYLRFGSTMLTNQSQPGSSDPGDGYVAKLDSSGNWLWAHSVGSLRNDQLYSVLEAPNGAVYVTGNSNSDSLRVGPWRVSSLAVPFQGSIYYQAFVAKLDSTGQWEWGRPIAAQGHASARLMQVNAAGDVFLTGSYVAGGSVSLPPYNLTSSSSLPTLSFQEAFAARLSASGQWQWARPLQGHGTEYINAAHLTPYGDGLLLAGSFTDSLMLGNTACYVSDTANYRAGAGFMAYVSAATGVLQWGLPLNAPVSFHQILNQSNGQAQLLATSFRSSLQDAGIPLATSPGPAALGGSIISLLIGTQLPRISSFSQPAGSTGTTIRLTGRFFTGATQLALNGQPAVFTVLTDSLAQLTIPLGATSGYVQITTPRGSAQSPLVLQVIGPLAAADLPEATASLAPNPASGTVRLRLGSGPTAPVGGQLLDAMGRVVRGFAVHTADTTLDLRGLPAGFYTARVGAVTRRLVIE